MRGAKAGVGRLDLAIALRYLTNMVGRAEYSQGVGRILVLFVRPDAVLYYGRSFSRSLGFASESIRLVGLARTVVCIMLLLIHITYTGIYTPDT